MTNEELNKILARPTAQIKDAGRALGLSPSSSYAAAKSGQIHAIKIGGKLIVPTAWLRKQLMLEE